VLASEINVRGTANVVDACKSVQSKLVYISTSSVFDGSNEKYFETDTPVPSTHYGKTKLNGEELVKKSGLPYLILRTDQPYCWTEKWQHTNSVLRILEKLGKNENWNEVTDWFNTPTYVPDFIQASFSLIKKNACGIFHVVGSDFISRYDWSLQIADIFKLDKKLIHPINSATLGLPVKRPNVYLSNDKLYQQVGIRMMGTKEGLMKMLSDAEKNHYTN
jgi:dTDP-4-dehydrorhamnose reductase